MQLNLAGRAKLFIDYLPLTYRLSAKFARKYHERGIQFQDLLDHAQSVLGRITADWNNQGDPNSKCKPMTWIYKKLNYELLTFCTRNRIQEFNFTCVEKQGRDDRVMDWESQTHLTLQGSQMGVVERLVRDFSADAAFLVRTIIESPIDLFTDLLPKKTIRKLHQQAKKYPLALSCWCAYQKNYRSEVKGEGGMAVAVRRYCYRQGWSSERLTLAWDEVRECL